MPQPHSTSTHYLFLRIVAAVGSSKRRMTVGDLGKAMKLSPEVVAQCIALHLYLERTRRDQLPLPPPSDYWVPRTTDVITRDMLRPKSAGQMLAVEAAIHEAVGVGGGGAVRDS